MAELLLGWLDRYPIVSIEDPFGEDDRDGVDRVRARRRHRVQIIGDDYLTTNAARVAEAAADARMQRGADQAQPGGHADRNRAPH